MEPTLLVFLLILLAALAGSSVGNRIGSQYGALGGAAGLLIGAVTGVAVGCIALLILAFTLEPLDRLWRRLKHRLFGKRRRGDASTIAPGPLAKACEHLDRASVPGWLLPILSAALHSGIAAIALHRELIVKSPAALWMVSGIAAWGFVAGCVAWWRGGGQQSFDEGNRG